MALLSLLSGLGSLRGLGRLCLSLAETRQDFRR